ncbi:hypothetical protein ANANG_G00254040 [Anguilla anguilla]|uniref:CBM21 domain-containing protein n=1 Tax=Anguilla anguilla TaxID=7936 RepID=A0A9D3RQU7_ANGAN|nr:hypothetical protein ANANG_G00254040 [Anguilla anguilla]
MSNGNNYLNLPSKETILSTKSAEETDNSAIDDEDDDEECYTLVPRSSPVPRKRGLSLFDETVEYMKIRLTLPSRRVSFVDSLGGDLVEVKEFVAFDSDEEEDPRWEIEDARYRPATHEPIYQVCPDFEVPTDTALMLAVQKNKIEMESVSVVEHDPLSFTGLIRVLNICFNKSVYVRFTMDGWGTFFDYPADYVQGSNDVETDQYSFKLSFAGPYITHGSRIEFVLRYETPEGDYWANNEGKNYAVVLNVSYMDDTVQGNGMDDRKLKSILKAARAEDDFEEIQAADSVEADARGTGTETAAPKRAPARPQIARPKIDIENKDARPSSPSKTDTDHRIVDSVPLCASEPPCETPLSVSAVEQVAVFKPITSQPLATQPQSESPQKADFTKRDWVVEEHKEDTRICSYDTKTKITVKVSSESHIFCRTTTSEQILPPHDENGHEKDQDALKGESDSEPPYKIQEPPLSIRIPYKDPDTDYKLEMEANDQIRQDVEGYLRYTEAFGSSQGLVSESQETGPPEEVSETDPEGELSVPRPAVTLSGEEPAGFDSICTRSPPVYPKLVRSEKDQPSESPEEPVNVPYPARALHFLPDELATEFDELLVSSGYDTDPTESLLECPVASVGEISHTVLDTMGEITTPPHTADPDVVMPSVSHTYSHVPDQGVWEEVAEEYSFCTVGPSDSASQGLESLVEEEVVHQEAAELAVPQSDVGTSNSAPQSLEDEQEAVVHHQAAELASRLRRAYVASSVFLTFAFCLVLAYHHPHILPLVLLYLICL